jgi:hypothetical protein
MQVEEGVVEVIQEVVAVAEVVIMEEVAEAQQAAVEE